MGREYLIIRSNYDTEEQYNIALAMLPALEKNIATIKKVIPNFSMSDEQIKQQLSKERIRAHIEAKNNIFSEQEFRENDKKIRSQYQPNNYLPSNYSRNSYFMTRPETNDENKKYNRNLYTGITRDDKIGQKKRLNYTLDSLNAINNIDLEKMISLNNPTEKIEFSNAYKSFGGATQEYQYFITNSTIKLNSSGEKKFEIIKGIGVTCGDILLKYPQVAADNSFLTLPIEYIESADDITKITVECALNSTLEKADNFVTKCEFRKHEIELPEEYKLNESNLINLSFSEEDVYETEMVAGGYDARISDLLDGLTSLENIQLSGIYASKENKAALDTIREHSSTIKSIITTGPYYLSEQDIKKISDSLAKISESSKKIEIFIAKQPKYNENKAYTTINAFKPTSSLFQKKERVDALIQYQQSDEALIPGIKELNGLRNTYKSQILTAEDISEYKTTLGAVLENANKRLSQDKLSEYEREIIELSIARFECQIKSLEKAGDGVTLKEALSLPVKSPIKKLTSLDNLVLTLNTAQYLESIEGYRQLKQDCKNLKSLVDFQLTYCPDELSAQALKKLQEAFTKYIKSSTEFLTAHGSQLPESVRMAIEYSNIPLSSYMDNLKAGATEFSAVIKNTEWFKILFNEDTPAPNVEGYNPETDAYKASDYTIEENLNKYKELSSGVPKILEHHLEVVTGNSKDPYGALDFKMGLLIDNIQDINKYVEPTMLEILKKTPAKFKELRDDFDFSKLSISSGKNLFSKSLLEKNFENNFSTQLLFDMAPSVWDKDLLDNIKEAVGKKLRFKGPDLGINNKLLDDLDNANVFVNRLLTVRGQLDDGRGITEDKNHPFYYIFRSIDAAIDNAYAYLRGDEKAHVPGIEDVKLIYQQMDNYAQTADMYEPNHRSYNLPQFSNDFHLLINALFVPGKINPEIQNLAMDSVKRINVRFIEEYNNLFSELVQNPITQDYSLNENYAKISSLSDYILSETNAGEQDSTYNNYKYLLILTAEDYANNHINSLNREFESLLMTASQPDRKRKANWTQEEKEEYKKNLFKSILLAKYFDGQRKRIANNINANDLKERYLNGDNPALEAPFLNNAVPLDSDKFNKIVNDYIEHPYIKSLLDMGPQQFKEFIENPDFEKRLDIEINGPDRLKDINEDTLDILFQHKRLVGVGLPIKLSKANSQEFTDIQTALFNVSNARVTPGSDMKEAYNDLFKKCFTYVLRKNAQPSTEVGKARFKSSCEMMLKLGLSLRKDYPDLAQGIDAALNITAIRSKDFREEYLRQNLDNNVREHVEALDKYLNAKVPKGMIPEEIAVDSDAFKLLQRYENVRTVVSLEQEFDNISKNNETLAKNIIRGNGGGDVVNLLSEMLFTKSRQGKITIDNVEQYNDPEFKRGGIELLKPYVEFVLKHTTPTDMSKLVDAPNFAEKFYQGVKRVSEDKKLAPKAQSEYLSRHENELDGPQELDEIEEEVEVKKSKKM